MFLGPGHLGGKEASIILPPTPTLPNHRKMSREKKKKERKEIPFKKEEKKKSDRRLLRLLGVLKVPFKATPACLECELQPGAIQLWKH